MIRCFKSLNKVINKVYKHITVQKKLKLVSIENIKLKNTTIKQFNIYVERIPRNYIKFCIGIPYRVATDFSGISYFISDF